MRFKTVILSAFLAATFWLQTAASGGIHFNCGRASNFPAFIREILK
jgi:hypothetical protein